MPSPDNTADTLPNSALTWTKASASTANGNCVELAVLPDGYVAMRDSKDPNGPRLKFSPTAFTQFADGMRDGVFDALFNRTDATTTAGA